MGTRGRKRQPWQERARQWIEERGKKHLTATDVNALKRGPAARAPTREVYKWLSEQIEAGKVTVAHGAPKLGTKRARSETRGGEQGEMRRRVRMWTANHAPHHPTLGATTLTCAQVNKMTEDARWGTRAEAVRYTVMEAMAGGQIKVEEVGNTRSRDHGGRMHTETWADQAREWATQAGWEVMSEDDHNKVRDMLQSTTTGMVVQEWGSGWEGATEGLRQGLTKHERLITIDITPHKSTGEKRGVVAPDVCMDMADHQGTLVAAVAKRSKSSYRQTRAVWWSPSCVSQSHAQHANKTKAGATGLYATGRRDAKEERALEAGLASITTWVEEGKRCIPPQQRAYCVENPARSAMTTNPLVKKHLGEPYAIVPGCGYGKLSQKNYVVWTNVRGWKIREKCDHCKRQTRHPQAHQPREGQSHVHEEGYNKQAARNRVPPALANEWLTAAKQWMD